MASTGEPFGLFWNSENGDRTYDANSFEYWLKKFFTSGVFEGDLFVSAKSGMTIEVSSGYANVDGKVKFWNAEFDLTLSPANSTYPRIDTIVITRDNVNRQIECEVVTGQYSGDTPQPTAPIRNAEIYQLVLAQIYVGNGVTEITQSNITDTRTDTDLCGYITGTVHELDFSQFTAQFEAYFAEFKRQHETDWSAWETAQQAAYAAWFALVQQQQIADKAAWDAWYADLQEELHNLPADSAEYLQIQIDEIRQSGTTGSIIHITTTETSLEGKTVTVTCGTEVRTAEFDSNLECTISGFKSVGLVTITSSDGIDTATRTLTIDYFSNYDVRIRFWSATVNITSDDGLDGYVVTVRDSNDVTVGTVTLDAYGSGTIVVEAADTYSFEVAFHQRGIIDYLTVSEQTTYTLHIEEHGGTVTPTDDVLIWLECAGIFDKDYSTIAQVLADSTTLLALISDSNAATYMARSTTWASTVTANQTAMTYIGANDDCADALLADSTWLNAICDSTYFESVLNVKVPTMTSNTTPSGTVIFNDEDPTSNPNRRGYQAFDKVTNDSTSAWSGKSVTNVWIGYDFESQVRVYKVSIMPFHGQGVKNFILQGSNDGTNWSDIYTNQVPSITAQTWRTYSFQNNTPYRYIRLFCNDTWRTGGGFILITELQFYGRASS